MNATLEGSTGMAIQRFIAGLTRRADKTPQRRLDAAEVLQGLAPSLIIHLARLAGRSLDDVSINLQTTLYGDRAVMAAYGMVELAPEVSDAEPRPLVVLPFCMDVIAEAARFVAENADPLVVASQLRFKSEDLPWDDPYIPLTPAEETGNQGGAEFQSEGVVTGIQEPSGGIVRLYISFAGKQPPEIELHESLSVYTDADKSIHKDSRVSVGFIHDASGALRPTGISAISQGGR